MSGESVPWVRLTCVGCGRHWERSVRRGTRPIRCPECRATKRYSVVSGTTVYLGPGRCNGCQTRVWWASANTRVDGWNTRKTAWREQDGTLHRCPTWDNTGVGISDAITDTMCDVLSVADTSREDVSRLEVSAP